jgi:hypothetical protein
VRAAKRPQQQAQQPAAATPEARARAWLAALLAGGERAESARRDGGPAAERDKKQGDKPAA